MENYKNSLRKFRRSLHNIIEEKYKKVDQDSVIISILKRKSNDAFRLLNDAALERNSFPAKDLEVLIEKGLIREIDMPNKFTLTFKGAWESELEEKVVDEDKLFSYLDDRYFNFYKEGEKSFSGKEKLVLMSMIAARSFSEKSPVDASKGKSSNNAWEKIISGSYDLLKSMGILSEPIETIYRHHNVEEPVSHFFRHTDALPKKTKGIFRARKQRKYYLDLYQEGEFDSEKLKFLLKKVLGEKQLSMVEIDKISDFCNSIAATQGIYVFNTNEHVFSNPSYDLIIRDAILGL